MRCAGETAHGLRTRALIVLLWRAGLRIGEALALAESVARGAVLVRRGKGGKRREVGMDACGWQHLEHWLALRIEMPVGALLCVINGPTPGRPWAASAARTCLRELAVPAGVRRRFAPHQLRVTPTRSRWHGKACRSMSSQHDYARMLLARARPHDRESARDLLNQALVTYRELGMETHAAGAVPTTRWGARALGPQTGSSHPKWTVTGDPRRASARKRRGACCLPCVAE
jgi:integrase